MSLDDGDLQIVGSLVSRWGHKRFGKAEAALLAGHFAVGKTVLVASEKC